MKIYKPIVGVAALLASASLVLSGCGSDDPAPMQEPREQPGEPRDPARDPARDDAFAPPADPHPDDTVAPRRDPLRDEPEAWNGETNEWDATEERRREEQWRDEAGEQPELGDDPRSPGTQ